MEYTLVAIRAGGGTAHPEMGGWWRTAPSPAGTRLTAVHQNGITRGDTGSVGTQTIYSLRDRGLLEAVEGTGNRVHPAYRLTAAGASLAEELSLGGLT